MSSTASTRTRALLFGGAAVAAACLVLGAGHTGSAGQPAAAPEAQKAQKAQKAPEDRPADREAVRKALDAFCAAFQKGDAKAVADLWTPTGEYVSDEGTTIR